MSRSSPVLPYRVLDPDAVMPVEPGWAVLVAGSAVASIRDGEALPTWDAQLRFSLQRSFRLPEDMHKRLGLGDDAAIDLAVIAASGNGVVREKLFQEEIGRSTRIVDVVITPTSDRLAKDIAITTGLYLGEAAAGDGLAPFSPGHKLWELSERFRLEGGSARLPIYEVCFAEAFPGEGIEHAEFHVEITDDLDLPVESGLLVYLNSDFPAFIRDVSQPGSAAERQLWSAVVRRVLSSAALRELPLSEHAMEGDSIAATVARWTAQIWPRVPLGGVKDLLTSDYSLCEAQFESWVQGLRPTLGARVRR